MVREGYFFEAASLEIQEIFTSWYVTFRKGGKTVCPKEWSRREQRVGAP